MNAIVTAVKSVANLVYPLRCASCGKPLDVACESGACALCESRIRMNPKPYCTSCGRTMDDAHHICSNCRRVPYYFSRAYAACLYEGTLKEMIHAFKYKNNRAVARIFTRLLTRFIRENRDVIEAIEAITFVPLGARKQRIRGYNQSELLAGAVSKTTGMPVVGSLEKTARTRSQSDLPRQERLTNVQNAFRVRRGAAHLIKGRYLLLIDDVMTTGATLNECSHALIEAGARDVRCLTLARGL